MRRRQTSKQRRVQMTTITQAAVGTDGPPRSRLGADTSSRTPAGRRLAGYVCLAHAAAAAVKHAIPSPSAIIFPNNTN